MAAAPNVNRPVAAKTKPSILRYHRWLALAAGLVLVMQGLSGAFLVFRGSIEPIVHPELRINASGKAAEPQELIDLVSAAAPDFAISRVEYPVRTDRAVIYKLSGKNDDQGKLIAVDPFNRRIVREGDLSRWPIEWLRQWHEEIHGGPAGEVVIGLIGLTLLFIAVSGIISWWPAGRFVRGFRIVRGGKEMTWRSAHRSIGAIAALVLLFSTTTGALMIFKGSLREALALAGPVASKPSTKVAERPGIPLVSVDGLVKRAKNEIGPSPLRQLRFSGNDGRSVSVYLDATGNAIGGVTSYVAFDRYTGKELGRYVSGQLPTNNALIDYLYPLHTGAAGGFFMKAVLLLGAFALVFLGVTGPLLWLVRERRNARNKAGRSRRTVREVPA